MVSRMFGGELPLSSEVVVVFELERNQEFDFYTVDFMRYKGMFLHENEGMCNVPTVPEYFKNKTIFITGGSGFMGQALIEKLLYSCSELDKIYLLMRQKKGVLPTDRLEKLYSSSCFDRLRKEKPTIFYEKVHIIAGDVLDLGLGLADSDRSLLIDKVNIIFHVAASVRLNDPLSYAVKINIRGTRELIALAKEMRNISSFVHVSTCFCNCKYEVADEVLYPPLADWCEVVEVCDTMDEEMIRILTPKYLNGMPNTYVFTKHLAEHLVNEERGNLPVVIIRPSIVTGSKEEPAPGWVNNFNGPNGLSMAIGKGIKYSIYGDENIYLNYIPVDICIKSFIVTAWVIGTNRLRQKDNLPIFNCSLSPNDMLTLREMSQKTIEMGIKWPVEELLWIPKFPVITKNFYTYYSVELLCCILPATLIDCVMWICGRKGSLFKIQKKVYEGDMALNYFLSRNLQFINKNFLEIRKFLRKEDMKHYYYDTENLFTDDSYSEICTLGIQKYLLNINHENVSRAAKKYFRLKLLDLVCRIIFYGYFLWLIINANFVKNIYQNCLQSN